jgi:hypothetical protein
MPKPTLTLAAPPTTSCAPPRKLGPTGRQLWDDILREFDIADRAGLELLCLAAEAVDRAERLAACIDRDGEVVATKTGPRAHPALRDELANRAFCARTLERLGLTTQPTKPIGRPPTTGVY